MVCALILYMNVDSERQIFEKLFIQIYLLSLMVADLVAQIFDR